jgi:hypothetical protein
MPGLPVIVEIPLKKPGIPTITRKNQAEKGLIFPQSFGKLKFSTFAQRLLHPGSR